MRRQFLIFSLLAGLGGLLPSIAPAQPPRQQARQESLSADGVEFFESKIRPLLVKRCYKCHSAKSDPLEGGLRLDTRAGWQKGGDSGPVLVPGKSADSRLIKAVLYTDEDLAMPPDAALSGREVALLRRWIDLGAPDPRVDDAPRTGPAAIDWSVARDYWAFRPLSRELPPRVSRPEWARNPIDRFILARLDDAGLAPVPRGVRERLLRRVSLDVTGLPPTLQMRSRFLADTSPAAWSRLVDRLLASPAYGERWGRHWLDVARYADDQIKNEYFYRDLPHAWRYRDWVIRSFNEDLPYDRFVVLQLAGDLLPQSGDQSGDHDGTVAVGLLAIGLLYQDDGGTPDGIAIARAETLDDRVDTITRGLLALTVSCARCHDHKFDPIPTADYYSLAGIFDNTSYIESAPLADAATVRARKETLAYVAALTKRVEAARKAGRQPQLADLSAALAIARRSVTPMYPLAHSARDSASRDMPVALRGNLRKPGPIVPRRFLQTLTPAGDRPRFTRGSGRLELARAIADRNNPLTARVIVNRLWQHHFGRGLVATASNFGAQGERPTHPRLLDWLAARLVDADWSLKKVHREILQSATYQLSTTATAGDTAKHTRIDADNRLLWRMNRKRLDIEAWRDSVLATAGTLDCRLGGPAEPDLLTSTRRTVYGAVRRDNKSDSDALLRLFDFPNPRISSSGRITTTIPQQQLFLMNSPFILAQSRALAGRVAGEADSLKERVERVFLLSFARRPTKAERRLAAQFLAVTPSSSPDAAARWRHYCQVLLVANELLFRP